MNTEIKKVNKNYYSISAEPICSVFLDEYLMKKANKILYKYENELSELLENNEEHLIEEHWSLAYPNGKQKEFYATNLEKPKWYRLPKFITNKVKNLFYIGDENIYGEEVRNEITKLLEKEEEAK